MTRPLNPAMRVAPPPWTDAEKEAVSALWAQTAPVLSASQIGAAMGKTKSQIMGITRRLKLPQRGSPIPSDSPTRRDRTGTTNKAPILRSVHRVAGPPEMPKILAVFDAATDAQIEARNRAVTRRGCEFPMWGHAERPTHRYCGARVVGGPYCDEHRRVCCS